MKNILNIIGIIILVIVLFALLTIAAYSVNGQAVLGGETGSGEIQGSGGQFTLHKSAIAGGGNQTQQGPMAAKGTTGQSIAGRLSNGGQFRLYSGFWTPDDFVPTAGGAVVGGRVLTAEGNGITKVIVIIRFPTGETKSTLSTAFGHYTFVDIPAGLAYTISVSSKRFRFAQPIRIVTIQGDTEDIDFIATAQVSKQSGDGQEYHPSPPTLDSLRSPDRIRKKMTLGE